MKLSIITKVLFSFIWNLGLILPLLSHPLSAFPIDQEIFLNDPCFDSFDLSTAAFGNALDMYQLGEIEKAEQELRIQIRRCPMSADARAALVALLSSNGRLGEAQSHWAAVEGLDKRYTNSDWLLNSSNWPSGLVDALLAFLAEEAQ